MLLNKKSPDKKSHHKKSHHKKSHRKKLLDKKLPDKKSHRKKFRMIDIKDLIDVKILKFFNFFDKRSEWLKNRNKINTITNSFFIFLFFLNPHKNLTFIKNEHLQNNHVIFSESSIEDSIKILNGPNNFVLNQNINNFIDRDTFINFFKKNLDINSFTLIQFFNDDEKKKYYIIGLNEEDNLFMYDPFTNDYINISLHYFEFIEIIGNLHKFTNANIFLRTDEVISIFNHLCYSNIFGCNIDGVIQKVHLNNSDNCNIFLIGEMHKRHDNPHLQSINDILKTIADTNENDNGDILKIDLLIEMFPTNVDGDNSTNFNDEFQINQVRETFKLIIKNKKINSFFAHWCDPFNISKEKKNYDDFPTWLKQANELILQSMSQNMTSNFFRWSNDPYIKKFFAPFERPDDIHKLLTENKIFMKELGKVQTQNDIYDIDYFKVIFSDIFNITKEQASSLQSSLTQENKNNLIIFNMWRTVMDMYTITRILCKNLKNVIFYGGANHSERIMYILIKYFNFKVINENIELPPHLEDCWLPTSELRRFYTK